MDSALDLLKTRRSTPSRLLVEPGPDDAQLRELIEAAARVPDHGLLKPWRLLLVRREEGRKLGEAMVAMRDARGVPIEESAREKDLHRFDRAPLMLVLISSPTPGHKVPQVEQFASAAAFAQNILLAAHAMGFGAQWLTAWPAYDRGVFDLLGLGANESIVGFMHLGTASSAMPDLPRPRFDDIVQDWSAT